MIVCQQKLYSYLRIKNGITRGCLAEFLSAFIHVALTIISVAASLFSGNKNNYLLNCIHAGLAVFFAMHAGGGVTGALLNPAVTFSFAFLGKLSWKKCLFYSVSQYCGAFAAAGLLYFTFSDALDYYDGGVRQALGENGTAAIFGTFPGKHLSFTGALINSTTATAILLIGVLGTSDRKNWRPLDPGLLPLINGIFVITLNMAFGYNSAAAMNPARDLSPRVFSYLFGWGSEVFSLWDYHWFYIPVVSSYGGALIGSLIYTLFIEIHWEVETKEDQNDTYAVQDIGSEVIKGYNNRRLIYTPVSANKSSVTQLVK